MKFSIILLGVVAISCVSQRREEASRAASCDEYDLREGTIVCVGKIERDIVPISGFVHCLYQNADELYYICSEKKDVAQIKAGYCVPGRKISHEVALPNEITFPKIVRFVGAGGAAFFVASSGKKGTHGLYRVDFNSGKISEKKGISDVVLYEGAPVVLRKHEEGFFVYRGGVKTPVTLGGTPKFGNLLEGRIMVIVSGEKKELIDLGIMKNVHGFGGSDGHDGLAEENLYIEATDHTSDTMTTLVYYKVFINGAYIGRTDTGPAGQNRTYSMKLSENEYHIVKLERWELHEGKNSYERANNINQPAPVKLFLPQHRATKLVLVRERKGYRSSSMTLQK